MVAELEQSISLEDPRNHKSYYLEMTRFRQVATPVLLGAFSLLGNVRVSGAEKVPADGPVVLAANHLTNYDVLPLQMAVQPRPIYFMGKEELFRNPIMDWPLRQLGGFPVYRGARDDWAMRHAEKVLKAGLMLGIFPEGTRGRGRGLKTAKTGAARLALDSGCPILPVALHGPQYMLKRFPRRTPVDITIGDPIQPHPRETALNLTDRVMFALAEMLPPAERGIYSFRPKGF